MKTYLKILLYLIVFLLLPTAAFCDAKDGEGGGEVAAIGPVERASDSTRVVTAPTATGREKGEWGLTVYDFVLADIEYGLFKHLEIGLDIAAPITFVGFAPHAKFWGRPTSKMTVAFNMSAIFIFPYIGNDDFGDQKFTFLTGGPLLTFGSKDSFLNVGFQVARTNFDAEALDFTNQNIPGIYYEPSESTSPQQAEIDTKWIYLPTIGFVGQVNEKVSLIAQLEGLFFRDNIFPKNYADSMMGTFFYGLRFHGKRVTLDVAFLIPLVQGFENMLKYCPIGFPLITISKSWPKE